LEELDSGKSLKELGYTKENSKAETPASLIYTLSGETEA
jgi:hypothetical protein